MRGEKSEKRNVKKRLSRDFFQLFFSRPPALRNFLFEDKDDDIIRLTNLACQKATFQTATKQKALLNDDLGRALWPSRRTLSQVSSRNLMREEYGSYLCVAESHGWLVHFQLLEEVLHGAPHFWHAGLGLPLAGLVGVVGQDVELAPEFGEAKTLGKAVLVETNGIQNLSSSELK